jgi:hypothetical protein
VIHVVTAIMIADLWGWRFEKDTLQSLTMVLFFRLAMWPPFYYTNTADLETPT